MLTTPVKHASVEFKKSALLEERLLLGIDCGSSLTNIVFLHKDNEAQLLDNKNDFVSLTYSMFKNENFEYAIKWTLENTYIPKDKHHHIITGNCDAYKKDTVESILGLKTEYVAKSLTVCVGCRFGLENISMEQLVAPPVEVRNIGKFDSKFLEKFADALSSKLVETNISNSESSVFPCLVYVYGTNSRIILFDKDGKGEFISYSMLGKSTFLGLAKCLLDTNNFDEIIKLASTGNRGNVDTQFKEIFSNNDISDYGMFPPDTPVFSFGKSTDFNTGLEDYAKEDVAMSLVAFFAHSILMQCVNICQMKKMPKIFLTGSLFNMDLFIKEIKWIMIIIQFSLELTFLEFSYCGALGAIFCNDKDK